MPFRKVGAKKEIEKRINGSPEFAVEGEKIQKEYNDIIVVPCKNCKGGEETECLDIIIKIVESDKIAFMLYSKHVEEKVKDLNYKISLNFTDLEEKIPFGMWITK